MSKKRQAPAIRAVLFDLGKVLLHFNFDPAFKKLSRASGLAVKDIEDYFVSSGLEVLYDGGKISSRAFYAEIRKALGLKISFGRFQSIWNGIFTPKKEMIALARRLSKKYRLVIISNTNQMHSDHIRKKYAFIRLFDGAVFSWKEKMRKPDEKIYRTAARLCRARPDEIYYIDDRPDLTAVAEELGFRVFTYQNNYHELVADMKAKGVH